MGWSIRWAEENIDARELAEWLAYYRVEPFGEERDDMRSASIACTMANIHRGKNQRAYRISEFMLSPSADATKPEQTPAQMKAVLQSAFSAFKASGR